MGNAAHPGKLHRDIWIWGTEKIVWGFDDSHGFTFKLLEPKLGRAGCMSLQYHQEKSEVWLVLRGLVWSLFVFDGLVCTRILKAGDIQTIQPGTIHRLTGITADVRIAEPSTPDKHAANKSLKKDVIRLHCVHGREVTLPKSDAEQKVLKECIRVTEEALALIDMGKTPPEYRKEHILGAFSVES